MPQIKVTQRKAENQKLERIIEILQPVPEHGESKLSNAKKRGSRRGSAKQAAKDAIDEQRSSIGETEERKAEPEASVVLKSKG